MREQGSEFEQDNRDESPEDVEDIPEIEIDEPYAPLGVPLRSWILGVGATIGGLFVLIAMCSIPGTIREFQPEPTPIPPATPTHVPTYTPVPTWTPIPIPTITPRPITDLPIQQLHYDEYRIFHLLYEYTLCYREYVDPPLTPTPPVTPDIDPEATANPSPQPTFTPAPTPTFINPLYREHLPPEIGLSDRQVEDHVLRDVGGATRWLIERYRTKECTELPQFVIMPERLTWLHRYAEAR